MTAKLNPTWTNFTAGEISPRMKSRHDVARYSNGCQLLQNMYIWPQGGASKRPGTIWANVIKNSASPARLYPFIFSSVQAYMLEFGNNYIRFYKNGGSILSAGVPYEVTTTYLQSELPDLYFTQSADVLFICHPNHPPAQLNRFADTNWTLTDVLFNDGPYKDGVVNLGATGTSINLTPAAISGTNILITASSAVFLPAHATEQRWLRLRQGAQWGNAKIITYVSSTQVRVNIIASFFSTLVADEWRIGAWGALEGYPSVVTFHEQRLIFASTTLYPQTVWMSSSGQYVLFSPSNLDATVTDSNAIYYTIASNKVNVIKWLSSGPTLLLGTVGAEWQVKAASISQPLTPTNIQITPQTTLGSKNINSLRSGSACIFVQRSGRKLQELTYEFQTDAFVNRDLSLISEHLLREGNFATDFTFQQEPNGILWLVRNDGLLLGVTYLRDQQIVGWHRHQIGGSFSGGNAVVESVATIPSIDNTSDQLWLIVKRTINGLTVRSVEYMGLEQYPVDENDKSSLIFLDASATYAGVPATVISGLDYLEGQTVGVYADGSVQSDAVVTGGSITLSQPRSIVTVGLRYSAKIQVLPAQGSGQFGTISGKVQRPNQVTLLLLTSLGGKYGPTEDNLSPIEFRSTAMPMDSSPPLFSGFKSLLMSSSYDREGTFFIVQDDPYPFNVLEILPEMVVYEKN